MSTFVDALRSGRVLLMDGGMGTELQKRGLKPDECGEAWNITHPDQVSAIHRSYVESGAEVLLTNTFQSTAAALARRGCRQSPAQIVNVAVNLARASGKWVVGDIGPFDETAFYDEQRNQFVWPTSEIVAAMSACDAILIETLSDVQPLVKVLKSPPRTAGKWNFLASATYLRNESGEIATHNGWSPKQFVQNVEKLSGIVAVGVNCGREIGTRECVEIAHEYRDNTHLPVFVRPNAGTPKFRNERWVYPHSPKYMASWLPELLAAGVRMIGGCCGTTPAHIAAFKKVIDEWNGTHGAVG